VASIAQTTDHSAPGIRVAESMEAALNLTSVSAILRRIAPLARRPSIG